MTFLQNISIKKSYIIAFLFLLIIIGTIMYRSFYTSQVDQIFQVIEQYRLLYDIDTASVETSPQQSTAPTEITGIDQFKKQLASFTAASKPISMLLVGWPFKSANTEQKVFGTLPDMAERKSLEYLNSLLDNIKAVYPPGATLTIFCDGIQFAKYLGIPFERVVAYESTLKILASDFPDIILYTSSNIMQKNEALTGLKAGVSREITPEHNPPSHAALRRGSCRFHPRAKSSGFSATANNFTSLDQINNVIDQYPPTLEQFKASERPTEITFKKRIALELEHAAGQKLIKAQTLDTIVFNLMLRQARMRNYIAELFPSTQYLRVTAHFSSDISKKLGIKLSPSSLMTPYHGVCVIEPDNSWRIAFKKDVDTSAYHIESTNIHGIDCPFFKHN